MNLRIPETIHSERLRKIQCIYSWTHWDWNRLRSRGARRSWYRPRYWSTSLILRSSVGCWCLISHSSNVLRVSLLSMRTWYRREGSLKLFKVAHGSAHASIHKMTKRRWSVLGASFTEMSLPCLETWYSRNFEEMVPARTNPLRSSRGSSSTSQW